MLFGALGVIGAFTIDRTIPVSALNAGVAGDMSPTPITAVARYFLICMVFSFPLRHHRCWRIAKHFAQFTFVPKTSS
jgi:hypothetical protein